MHRAWPAAEPDGKDRTVGRNARRSMEITIKIATAAAHMDSKLLGTRE